MRNLVSWCEQNKLGIILLPWLASAISTLFLKYSILAHGGFHECALGLRPSGLLDVWEKVSLFRSDLLLCGVLIPSGLCFLTRLFPLRWRVAIVAVFAFVVVIGLNIEVAVYHATCAFSSPKMIWVSIRWAISSHDTSIISIPLKDKLEIMAWIVGVGISVALALTAMRKTVRWLNSACLLALGMGAVTCVLASVPRAPEMAWSPSLISRAVDAALSYSNADVDMIARSAPELVRLYRQTAHIPASEVPLYVGNARGYNVLLVVLEAIPAQVFDPAHDSLRDMPNVRRLREHAFLSERHYTTFPLTNHATFSIFTSLYTKCAAGEVIANRQVELPGMIHGLKAVGYKTAFYGYVWKAPSQRDDRMLESLGFEKIVEPTIDQSVDRDGANTFSGPVSYVEDHDLQVLRSLREDIHRWTSEKQKFAAAFFPEIGHDPWRELNGHKPTSMGERGHALAVHQDAWLGELLDELSRDGALNDTVIIVTSDHGLRMLPSPPDQPVRLVSHGKLDDIVMRVPLLVYVPNVLEHPVRVDWPTSHIDITPTIMDLLGITAGRELEQGTAIWNPSIASRRLFLAMDTFGAAGFCDGGSYYMRSGMNSVFKNATLHFEDRDALAFNDGEAIAVRKALDDQDRLQHALLLHMFDSRRIQ